MGTKVNMGQQGALVAEVTVGTHCHHVEGSDPSLHSVLVRPQLQCCAQIWAPHNKSDLDMLERVQGRATDVSGNMEGLRDLGLFSCGGSGESHHCMEITAGRVEGRWSPVVPSGGTTGTGADWSTGGAL